MAGKKEAHDKYVKTAVSMPPELYKRLEKFCNDDERPLSWCIQKALDMWLKEKGY